jgi:phospholipase C
MDTSHIKTAMTFKDRRNFLRLGAATMGTAAAASFWPSLIEKAMAVQANNPTGTPGLADIEHVIIFMQENRSFDHYFGSMTGVRGFGDPRPTPIPSGNYAWYQPEGTSPTTRSFTQHISASNWTTPANWYQSNRPTQSSSYVLPFGLNKPGNVAYQFLSDLDHSWKQSQDTWKNWDVWVPTKSRQSMGFLTANDLPFYYPLANAFTICDDYHCSVFAATDPNRFYLWSGTCPPPMNFPDNYTNGGYVSNIANDNNTKITPAMYGQSAGAREVAVTAGVADWQTYAETLSNNAITWKIYQEDDNYGDNYLEYFKNFRIDNTGTTIDQSTDPYFQTLYQRGRTFAATAGNVGDAVIAQFAADVAAGMEPDSPAPATVKPGLPRVSWVVAPYTFCEHPSASPGDGESFTARLMDVLVNKNPDVFSKTVFMLMYDENDGYFDHVPSPVPPTSSAYGQMTMADAGAAETMSTVPVGLGPRVPMLVISPWTTGGKVSSQTYDHTSVLRFLEQWLTAKGLASADANQCKLISDWRRAVCGDLTEVFDFSKSGTTSTINTATAFQNGTIPAAVPATQAFPALPAPATRTACSLGYEFFVHGQVAAGQFSLNFANTGTAGAALMAYWMPMADAQTTFHYTIEAGKSLTASPVQLQSDGVYDWAVHGPNGFLREFRGNVNNVQQLGQTPEVAVCYDVAGGNVQLTLDNRSSKAATVFQVSDNAYYQNKPLQVTIAGGAEQTLMWAGSADVVNGAPICSGWYDISIRVAGDPAFLRRVAGGVQQQSGPLRTDPAIGNPALFKPSFSFQQVAGSTLRIDYVTPPWNHRPLNWFGAFRASDTPAPGKELLHVNAARGVGSVITSTAALPAGQYNMYYFFDGGYTIIAGPIAFTV